jgi:Protein of unknown function (DUF2585)
VKAGPRLVPVVASCVALSAIAAVAELAMGRSWLGPDGRFGLWEGNIWSSEQSQRFADPYSLSHVVHGFLFYAFLWLVARRLPVRYRLVAAVALEAAWEVLENSPIIIDRYRAVTIALGYVGDSILNSMSDILMMALGFILAWRLERWASIVAVVVIEVGLLLWVRDNLTLNILMLIHPIESIRAWQSAGITFLVPVYSVTFAAQSPAPGNGGASSAP